MSPSPSPSMLRLGSLVALAILLCATTLAAARPVPAGREEPFRNFLDSFGRLLDAHASSSSDGSSSVSRSSGDSSSGWYGSRESSFGSDHDIYSEQVHPRQAHRGVAGGASDGTTMFHGATDPNRVSNPARRPRSRQGPAPPSLDPSTGGAILNRIRQPPNVPGWGTADPLLDPEARLDEVKSAWEREKHQAKKLANYNVLQDFHALYMNLHHFVAAIEPGSVKTQAQLDKLDQLRQSAYLYVLGEINWAKSIKARIQQIEQGLDVPYREIIELRQATVSSLGQAVKKSENQFREKLSEMMRGLLAYEVTSDNWGGNKAHKGWMNVADLANAFEALTGERIEPPSKKALARITEDDARANRKPASRARSDKPYSFKRPIGQKTPQSGPAPGQRPSSFTGSLRGPKPASHW